MAQAVSRQPLTAETRFQPHFRPYGICGRQSGTGTGFSVRTSVFHCHYHFVNSTHTFHHQRYIPYQLTFVAKKTLK